jgi:hypothetical protein
MVQYTDREAFHPETNVDNSRLLALYKEKALRLGRTAFLI